MYRGWHGWLVIALALWLTGCASTTGYVKPDLPDDQLSTITGLMVGRVFIGNSETYLVVAVDNRFIEHGFFDTPYKYNVPVAEGAHTLVLQGSINRKALRVCPCSSFAELTVNIEKGKRYRVEGAVEGTQMRFWLTDLDSGKRVSDTVTSKYRPAGSSNYVPVFLPSN